MRRGSDNVAPTKLQRIPNQTKRNRSTSHKQ